MNARRFFQWVGGTAVLFLLVFQTQVVLANYSYTDSNGVQINVVKNADGSYTSTPTSGSGQPQTTGGPNAPRTEGSSTNPDTGVTTTVKITKQGVKTVTKTGPPTNPPPQPPKPAPKAAAAGAQPATAAQVGVNTSAAGKGTEGVGAGSQGGQQGGQVGQGGSTGTTSTGQGTQAPPTTEVTGPKDNPSYSYKDSNDVYHDITKDDYNDISKLNDRLDGNGPGFDIDRNPDGSYHNPVDRDIWEHGIKEKYSNPPNPHWKENVIHYVMDKKLKDRPIVPLALFGGGTTTHYGTSAGQGSNKPSEGTSEHPGPVAPGAPVPEFDKGYEALGTAAQILMGDGSFNGGKTMFGGEFNKKPNFSASDALGPQSAAPRHDDQNCPGGGHQG